MSKKEYRTFPSPYAITTRLSDAELRHIKLSDVQEFPDPHMIYHDGVYYIYATNHMGVAVARSTDGLKSFEHMGLALMTELIDDSSAYMFWAPEVFYHNGTFYMHYSSSTFGSGGDPFEQRIHVATSNNPLGPFKNQQRIFLDPGPGETPHPEEWAIDPHMEYDSRSGEFVLFFAAKGWSPPKNGDKQKSRTGAGYGRDYKNPDNFYGTQIFMQQFSDPITPVPNTRRLAVWATIREELSNPDNLGDNPTDYCLEGATYLESEGTGFLMFSGNNWESPYYFISYASWNLEGRMMDAEFTKHMVADADNRAENFQPVLGADSDATGMGHHSIVIPSGDPPAGLSNTILTAHHGRPTASVLSTLPSPDEANIRRLYVTEITADDGCIIAHRHFE